ncbi:MAG: cation diffusion facilitator family transporter [Desulfotignum sp.]|jgi:cation diffusion facilitator family transporter|nr:cation diffusion facilitator family transporter [Desulfotignum sp.]
MDQKHSKIDDETIQIYRVAGYAFVLNLFLAGMKAMLAFFSGSLAITASAIDSATDAVASLVIYGGVKLSTKKTRAFPLGLYKLENVASVLIAIFIFIAGYEITISIFSSSQKIPAISLPFVGLLALATILTFAFGRYAIVIGRKTKSPTLVAEGRHRQVDVLSSLVVLFAAVLGYLGVDWTLWGITIDQMGACLILVFIARAGWELLSDGMRVLLDASIDFATLDQIQKIIKKEPLVDQITSLTGRNAGRFQFIHAGVTVKTRHLEKAHQVSEQLEKKIREQIPHIEKITILYEPQQRELARIALPLADENGRISAHFGEAPYFGMVHVRHSDQTITRQKIVENPHAETETAKGIRVAEWLVDFGVDHVGMKEDISHKGPGYVLANAGIKTHLLSCEHLRQAVSEISAAGL